MDFFVFNMVFLSFGFLLNLQNFFFIMVEVYIIFTLIKGVIHQEEITMMNLYAPNVGTPTFIKHTLKDLKSQIYPNTVVVGHVNTHPSPTVWSSRQKINKEILKLNDTMDQMDPTEVYRVLHSPQAQYTFFSAAHGTFSKIEHILGHKVSLNKYMKIEITPSVLSDPNAVKL
jgi:hypothetical protein